jgi:hypothetical protein
MWKFTELADWWGEQQKESVAVLDQWVEDSNYNQGVMIVAAGTQAVMSFGSGFVDVLRLGDGVAKGTAKGIGQDALRFVAIFPFGKAAQMLKTAKGTALAKVIVDIDPKAGICAWVASAKALTQIGTKAAGKLFVEVDDLAKAFGFNVSQIGGLNSLQIKTLLEKLGARTGAIRPVVAESEVARMVPYDGSVVMVIVELEQRGKIGWHAFYAYRTAMGQLRYMDRTVQTLAHKGYLSIDEIRIAYGATRMNPIEAMKIENMFVKTVLHEIPRLVMPVLGVIATEEGA